MVLQENIRNNFQMVPETLAKRNDKVITSKFCIYTQTWSICCLNKWKLIRYEKDLLPYPPLLKVLLIPKMIFILIL